MTTKTATARPTRKRKRTRMTTKTTTARPTGKIKKIRMTIKLKKKIIKMSNTQKLQMKKNLEEMIKAA